MQIESWTEDDLLSFIRNQVQESVSLDFKQSAALGKTDAKKNEISKDVSAMANAQGGILIYGMVEKDHIPTNLDSGVDCNLITKEWFESVIKSRIAPVIEQLAIKPIPLSVATGMVAYAVEVGQATSRAPHQAYDHRYYKRYNFESAPMEDYEVRDAMRRSIEHGRKYAAAWDLNVEMQGLIEAITDRCKISETEWLPRDRIKIVVPRSIRTAGQSIMTLDKPMRGQLAEVIRILDKYNLYLDTVDPGQRENARITIPLKAELRSAQTMNKSISEALRLIVEQAP
jgi:hypothetical protein